jgi:hypothetical protein
MSCNCKQVNKIKKTIPSIVLPEYEKKGIKKIFNIILGRLWHLLGFIIMIMFTIIAMPIIFTMAFVNYIRHGEMFISLPFIGNKNYNVTKEE